MSSIRDGGGGQHTGPGFPSLVVCFVPARPAPLRCSHACWKEGCVGSPGPQPRRPTSVSWPCRAARTRSRALARRGEQSRSGLLASWTAAFIGSCAETSPAVTWHWDQMVPGSCFETKFLRPKTDWIASTSAPKDLSLRDVSTLERRSVLTEEGRGARFALESRAPSSRGASNHPLCSLLPQSRAIWAWPELAQAATPQQTLA